MKQYKQILLSYQHRLGIKDWNTECETYKDLKSKYEESIKTLEQIPVLETVKPKIKLKTLSKTII